MKTKTCFLFTALIATMALTSCGAGSNTNEPGTNPDKPGGGDNNPGGETTPSQPKEVIFNESNPAAIDITVGELAAKTRTDSRLFRVSGYIQGIEDSRFGSFDLTDDTGSICVYGLRSSKSCITGSGDNYHFSSAKEFSNLNLHPGDYVTMECVHQFYGQGYWSFGELQGYAVKAIKNNVWDIKPMSYSAKDNYTGSYYSSVENKTGDELKKGLHDLLNETHHAYTTYDELDSYLKTTDRRGGQVRCFYSNDPIRSFNKEHVWPQSRTSQGKDEGNLYGETGAGADLHHLRATYKDNNEKRGNRKFGYCYNKEHLSTIPYNGGGNSYYTAKKTNTGTFEPADAIKGDIARIVAYVYIHYNINFHTDGDLNSYSHNGKLYLDNVLACGKSENYDLLRLWNAQDPVDEVEIARNEFAFEKQGNRNPFIDHPSYMDKVFA